jgi:ATP-dependent Clp protease adaptor protein ClpS
MSTKHNEQSDLAVAEKEKIAEPSDYNVVVHNNDYTSYDEVIIILSQAFEMSHAEALDVATNVDQKGKGICGTYSKEVADMKLMLVDMIKKQLINMMPLRQREINMLKFTVEKA